MVSDGKLIFFSVSTAYFILTQLFFSENWEIKSKYRYVKTKSVTMPWSVQLGFAKWSRITDFKSKQKSKQLCTVQSSDFTYFKIIRWKLMKRIIYFKIFRKSDCKVLWNVLGLKWNDHGSRHSTTYASLTVRKVSNFTKFSSVIVWSRYTQFLL